MRWCWLVLLLAACGSIREPEPGSSPADSAVVYNAIELGWTSSSYFVVSEVDGTRVHETFDVDRGVRLAAGQRRLAVRFYTEGLASSPRGRSSCAIDAELVAGEQYFLSGVAEGDRWGAALLDEAGAHHGHCRFAEGGDRGSIAGGTISLSLSALPAAPAQKGAPVKQAAAATPSTAVVRPSSAPAAASSQPAGASSAPAAALSAPAVQVATGVLPANDTAAGFAGGGSSAIVGGRGRGGCGPGTFRWVGVEGETLLLSGKERVRLLGARVFDAAAFAEYLSPGRKDFDQRCVRIELDDLLIPIGHRDREGRLLAYVFDGERFLNSEVIAAGVARVDTRRRLRYLPLLLAAQSEAR